MADQDLGVDIVVGEDALQRSLQASANSMRDMLEVARGVERLMKNTAENAGVFSKQIAELKKQKEGLDPKDALGNKFADDRIKAATDNYKKFNDEIREEIRLQQALKLARGAGERKAGERQLPDGRTVNDARQTEAALRNTILGIDTTAEQVTARLALATGKAMERMLTATGQAIENSFQIASQRQMQRNAQLSVPGYLDAKTTNARVSAEKAVQTAGRGETLAEREALDQAEKNRAFLQRLRQTSFAQEQRAVDADLKAQAAQAEKDRKTVLGIKQRSMLQEQRAEEASQKEAETKAEQLRKYLLGLKQRSMLQQQRAEEAADRAAGKDAARNDPAARQARVDAQIQNRNELFNSRGGADMFAFQAQLTSNYALFGALTTAITGSFGALIQFDEALKQFQAITSTSNVEMEKFRGSVLGVAAGSKFSVIEITQVAVALGQTGLAADGVVKALKPVMDLAAASGSTLQESVEAITGVLGAYNMEASRAGDVADVFVAALNKTKLTMGQLQLGIQYAANIARDSGVSFSELTASIGAMSQAGIRSGSTIGTGIRQLITELSSPTEKFRNVLKELNIDIGAVDLRTQGFTTILKTLRAQGFGTAEALRALDLRAASAFSALSGQADKITLLEQEFLLTSAATESAAKANESFTASTQRLTNVVFGLVDTAFAPLVTIMAKATGGTADLIGRMGDLGPTLPLIAAGIASIASAVAAIKITGLLSGLASLPTLGVAVAGAAPLAAGIAATGGILYYLSTLQTEADKAKARLDELTAIENGITGRQSTITTAIGDISNRIQTLTDRRDVLEKDGLLKRNAIIDAQKAFADFGLSVDVGSTSVSGLIEALQKLRGEMSQELPVLLSQQLNTITDKITELRKIEAEREKANQVNTGVNILGGGLDPLELIRGLGPQGQQVAGYLTGATPLDPAQARSGAAGKLMAELVGEGVTLRQSRTAVGLQEDTPERAKLLAAIDARMALIDEAIKLFAEKVSAVTNQQALRISQDRIAAEIRAEEIKNGPGVSGLRNQFEDLRNQQDVAIRAAETGGATGINRVEEMRRAARTTDPQVQAALATIEDAKAKAMAGGATKMEADLAFQEVTDALNGLLKASTAEIRNRFVAAEPAARAALQGQIRNAEAQLALTQRQASTANDPNRVSDLAGFAEDQQKIINEAREKLFRLDKGVNPDSVINSNPELREAVSSLKQRGDAAVSELAIRYAEIHRKVQQQQLSFEIDKQSERKDLIESQIKGFEKIRDDVRSSPEQAANAVREINRLLGDVAKILQSVNTLNIQKTDLKVPDTIGPTAAYKGGSVQDYILNTLKGQGASEERIKYALASGQIESGYAPDVVSGARKSSAGATGVFQFMPKTWNNMYGTRNVDTDVGAQLKAFQTFTDRNAGTFQSNMGRAATAEELYLMHQQGAAGALALLRGTGSAVDALAPAYGGNRGTALSAVTGNGGRADMGADEFANMIMRKFRSAAGAVGNPFSTTGRDAQKSSDVALRDKTDQDVENRKAENERKGAEAQRQAALADLKKQDKALSETYDTQLTLLRKAQDPSNTTSANAEAFKTLGQLFEKAQQADNLREDRTGPEGKAEAAKSTRERYAGLYSQQGLNAADTISKASEKQYTEELTRLQNMKKELERPENAAKDGNVEMLNTLNGQINALTKRNELQGEYDKAGVQILVLEQTLKEMKERGLDTDKETLSIRSRIEDLQARRKTAEPAMNLAATQAKTQTSYGAAFQGATDSFLKSRGILDLQGNVVDPVIRAQKTLEESLNAIGSAFDNLFTNLFSGTMKAGDALKKFATDILGNVMSSISKSLTNDIMKSLLGGGSKDSGGGIGGFISSLFGGGSGGGSGGGLFSFLGGGMALGGAIRMAGGGGVPHGDAALSGRDSRPVLAMPGEYMLRKSAVDAIGVDVLDQVNALGSGMVKRQPAVDTKRMGSSARAESNVFVVDRDQVPQPGPSDFVYAIGDNINKGGSIKTLIKRVAAGG